MGLTQVLCIYVMVLYLGLLAGLLTVEVGAVSDSFACFAQLFSPTGLPHSALIGRMRPSLTETDVPSLVDILERPAIF